MTMTLLNEGFAFRRNTVITKNGFRYEYSFLSNFAYLDTFMIYDKMVFPTNEHFYQAMKTRDRSLRLKISRHSSKGLKSFARNIEVREDWDDIKLKVMEYGLRYKFSDSNPTLRQALINTQGIELVEYNWWGDRYWGVCSKTNTGENKLGKMLMEIRGEIIGN